jgi:hypothetical protein
MAIEQDRVKGLDEVTKMMEDREHIIFTDASAKIQS